MTTDQILVWVCVGVLGFLGVFTWVVSRKESRKRRNTQSDTHASNYHLIAEGYWEDTPDGRVLHLTDGSSLTYTNF